MTDQKTSSVTAKFGGRELVFGINRADLPRFEATIGEPAQQRLTRIAAHTATVREIREVLDYAAPSGEGRNLPKKSDNLSISIHRSREDVHGVPRTFVGDVMSENPPMRYAVLAQGVLAAALHGLPVGASSFDENEDAEDVG